MTEDRERRLTEAVGAHAGALWRLCRGYERDAERRRDLYQDILVALWRALPSFEGRSSLRTFVLRVAHNTACAHVARARRRLDLVSLEELEAASPDRGAEEQADDRQALERLVQVVRRLKPLDRQIILLHLEGLEPRAIAEVTGLSMTNVTTKVSRIKALLVERLGMEG